MTIDASDIREDLAYLRHLVDAGDDWRRPFGQIYFAAGACYLVQMLLSAGQATALIPTNGAASLAVGFGPTAVFLVLLVLFLRALPRLSAAPPARAVNGFFGAMGLANLALALVIGWVAWRERSFTIWLIYPCTVFILQGAAWLAAASLLRRAWMAAVTAVWVVAAAVMAAEIGSMPAYIAAAAFGLAFGMAAPGAYMMRKSAS